MSIDAINSQYKHWLPIWTKCRDAIGGQECVHDAGETYLPRLSGQSNKEYEAYKSRALYFNASGRTLDGMTGLIFRKQPEIVAPSAMQPILDNVDMCGSPIVSFAEQLVDELIQVSRVGILVDYPEAVTIGMTLGQAQALGLRPYATIYKAESILDWRYESVGNAQTLVMVKLSESVDIQTGEYEYKTVEQLRILDIFEGRYRVRVYRKNESGWELFSEALPLMNNAPLRFIPFIFDSINGLDSDIKKPVMLDLVNVNLSHYRSSADYEHGLHFTGLPTPVFWGARMDDEKAITIGSAEALAFDDPSGHAEYLEFTGQGLSQLRTALEDKQAMMAALGSKMLASEKRAVESAETAMIHRSAEHSVLASISYSASAALTKMLQLLAEWARVSGEVSIKLNTDFAPQAMDAQMFQQLTQAYLTGAISYSEYFANLKEGEIIRSETTEEEEFERLQNREPVLDGA